VTVMIDRSDSFRQLSADVDFLGSVGDALPEEVVALMRKTGVHAEQLEGKVRSITFRATKS